MWGIFASLGSKIVGLLILVGAFFAAYFSIKKRGTLEERGKWEKATSEAKEAMREKVSKAVSKDAEIDAQTAKRVEEIKESAKLPEVSEDEKIFKF